MPEEVLYNTCAPLAIVIVIGNIDTLYQALLPLSYSVGVTVIFTIHL